MKKMMTIGIGEQASVFKEEPVSKYSTFDQERQHSQFWIYVRDKQWESAAAFLDHKVGY